ncbi:MAG: 2-vinyl bacteriochlorophyllide hydratase, partial [Gemmatimonadetes bacterium]|nr:2-vinyl bacteriochlorophyllide hydratase [Gemmatimonadota bacterium]
MGVSASTTSGGLYTPEQRARRDATRWTLVQGILAPLQFLVCIASAGLVLRYLATGEGLAIANLSVLLKTGILLLIMVTGSIWEKVVFDEWLFAKPFFWE